MQIAQLCGQDASHVDDVSLERPVHRELVQAWRALCRDAAEAGFDPALASGFRSYDRQLAIWNDKAQGLRPVLDAAGDPLDMARLSPWQQVQAILRWSALPGASRHHWGTDIDVYDRAAVSPGYAVQLTPAEVAVTGPFGPFHHWLDERIGSGRSHGFFRPYAQDRGGIAPERWHLSYAPLAANCQRALTSDTLRQLMSRAGLQLQEPVLAHWDEIFARFVAVPPVCYPSPWCEVVTTPALGQE